jgi:hypothetical protein
VNNQHCKLVEEEKTAWFCVTNKLNWSDEICAIVSGVVNV